jgi:hypothetical protein
MLIRRRAAEQVVQADVLNYGKLVLHERGPVVPGAGYAVTARSSEAAALSSRILPAVLAGNRSLDPTHLEPRAQERGGLLVRRLPLRDEDIAFGNSVALMRVRFRPEGGEDAGGRPHLQATVWVARGSEWQYHAAVVLAHADERLNAIPDRAKESSEDRFRRPAEVIETGGAPAITISTFENLVPEAERPLVARVLAVVLSGSRPDTLFGGDIFPDERGFLKAVGTALDLAERHNAPRVTEFHISVGLRLKGAGLCLRYLHSEKTTAPEADWRAVLERLPERREPPAPAAAAVPERRAAAVKPSGGIGPLRVTREAQHVDQPPQAPAPAVSSGTASKSSPARAQQDRLRDEYQDAPQRVPPRQAFEAWEQAFDAYRKQATASAAQQLVQAVIAAHPVLTEQGFEQIAALAPSAAALGKGHALALGLALYGRDDLSNRFSLPELLSFSAPVGRAAEAERIQIRNFANPMLKCIARRVCHLNALWPDEFEILRLALALIQSRLGIGLSPDATRIFNEGEHFVRQYPKLDTLAASSWDAKLAAKAGEALLDRERKSAEDNTLQHRGRRVPEIDDLVTLDWVHANRTSLMTFSKRKQELTRLQEFVDRVDHGNGYR